MGYIKIKKIYDKLKKAEEFYAPVIMTAATGWGKSAAAAYFYRRKHPLILYAREGKLTDMPSPASFRSSIVIIEDMQWMSEEESVSYIKNLLHFPGIQVVMLTRGSVIPKYLAAEDLDCGFIRIQEKDFALSESDVKAYFQEKEIDIPYEDIASLTMASHGYIRAIHCYAERIEAGQKYSQDMIVAVWHDIYRLWDGQVRKQWSDDFLHFALCVCSYDEFTIEMAEYLTGIKNVNHIIEYCLDTTSQLRIKQNGFYTIRQETRGFFIWKKGLVWSEAEILENYNRAANYYELNHEIAKALLYYQKARATQRVKELLIRNANYHPVTAHLIETREYYFGLPEKEIQESPVLMAGMSMIYSLILMPDKSEEWYKKLEQFSRNKTCSPEKLKEAKSRLAYLDIGIPHRGSRSLLGILKRVYSMSQKGEISLPELCAAGNMPSIMNGGLDFSEWSKNDVWIARVMGRPISVLLGDFGKGLVTLSLAESGFEKGTMSAYEVLTRCNDGFAAASQAGRIEMCFVSVGIQVRQHLIEGRLPSAKRVCDSFGEKVSREKADQLVSNYEAFRIWLSLFSGVNEEIKQYPLKVSDAKVFFSTLDRYQQMVKIRCLIAEDRLVEAMDLATFMAGYLKSYYRTFMWVENELLIAIILYRMENGIWKEHLYQALIRAKEYHFIRVIAMEGSAVLPLLKDIMEDSRYADVDDAYFKAVYKECIKVAISFPDYLKYFPRETFYFTKRESEVLSLLCTDSSMNDICATLGIGYDGLKKHNRNIYKKLGVKNRSEAERKALRLGLVHRGL